MPDERKPVRPTLGEDGLRWHPGGGQTGESCPPGCEAGDAYLVAVRVVAPGPERWEYELLTATEEGFEGPSGWSWSDVEWYVPTRDLRPPPFAE